MEHEADSKAVLDIACDVVDRYKIQSWSFDKGFWHPVNKELLSGYVDRVVMPKKGKRNRQEQAEEQEKPFKRLRNKHSAVESNINELEHRGLNRCPDRGYSHFKRYVSLGICAYNLHKIGAKLLKQSQIAEKKRKNKRARSLVRQAA